MKRRPPNFFVYYFGLPIGREVIYFRWVTFRWVTFRWVALPMGRPYDGSPFRWVVLSASQPGPSQREAEDAAGAPLLGAAPRHTALLGPAWRSRWALGPELSGWDGSTYGNYANRIMAVVTRHRAAVGGCSVFTGCMRTGMVERN